MNSTLERMAEGFQKVSELHDINGVPVAQQTTDAIDEKFINAADDLKHALDAALQDDSNIGDGQSIERFGRVVTVARELVTLADVLNMLGQGYEG